MLSSVPDLPTHCAEPSPSIYELSLQVRVAKDIKSTLTDGLQVPPSTAVRSEILQNSERRSCHDLWIKMKYLVLLEAYQQKWICYFRKPKLGRLNCRQCAVSAFFQTKVNDININYHSQMHEK